MKIDPQYQEKFESRHNAPDAGQIEEMLKTIGVQSVDELIRQTIPDSIRLRESLHLPAAMSEYEFLKDFRHIASQNKIFKSYIGAGYYNTITPGVILRNILENPGWYTAYTPYQAEVAQGRLEALINFQTMVIDLTGMEIANASLLDEGTAAAEAMHLIHASRKGNKKNARRLFVDQHVFPQTLDVLITRSAPIGVDLLIGDIEKIDLADPELFGVYVQYPDDHGAVRDHRAWIAAAHEKEVAVVMGTDLMSLLLLTSPGEMGADVVVGSSQRFGVPMGFGGPHAAFFATKDEYKRQMPGRIIGASMDAEGQPGYRMALQTREQHIRREKATSNICTAQVLLSVMAGMYAVYHGPAGLKKIALRIHGLAKSLQAALKTIGYQQVNENYFDTLKIKVTDGKTIESEALRKEINFRYYPDNFIGISIDETISWDDLKKILEVFSTVAGRKGNLAAGDEKNRLVPFAGQNFIVSDAPRIQHASFRARDASIH